MDEAEEKNEWILSATECEEIAMTRAEMGDTSCLGKQSFLDWL